MRQEGATEKVRVEPIQSGQEIRDRAIGMQIEGDVNGRSGEIAVHEDD